MFVLIVSDFSLPVIDLPDPNEFFIYALFLDSSPK